MGFLSILITTQNRPDALKKCIEALYASTDLSSMHEVIVVDDGSTDDTPVLIDQMARSGQVHMVIRNNTAKGPAAARNMGIRAASGEYVLIMGDDVLFFPDAIPIFTDYIKENGLENASVIGNIMPYPENITAFEWWSCNGGSQFGHGKISDEKRFDAGDEYFYTSNVITPVKLLLDNPFNETFPYARYEDRELAYRLKKKYGHKIHYLKEACSYHYHRLPFKGWLPKFEKFTWAAIHFANLYPGEPELRTKVGITNAENAKFFDFDLLLRAVDLVNRYHSKFFDQDGQFGHHLLQNYVTHSFRYLQEYFRTVYIKRHLGLPELIECSGLCDTHLAMKVIIERLEDDV